MTTKKTGRKRPTGSQKHRRSYEFKHYLKSVYQIG